MLRRIWQASIWHPDAIPLDEWKYRSLKRVWLPLYDLIAMIGGFVGAVWGIPALDIIFPMHVVDALGLLLAMVATVCLAGIAFPALYRVEIVGKIVLVGILGVYSASLWFLVGQGAGTRQFISVIMVLAIPIALFRLTLLGEEIKERKPPAVEEGDES